MLQPSTLKFLKDLKKNNAKEWFDKNRPAYDAARMDFATLVDSVIHQFGLKDKDIAILTAKESMFRINRDVRFSKNKAPYKQNLAASLTRGGKKSPFAGYYIHLEPGGNTFIGGGLWMAEPGIVKKVRQEIDYNFDAFRKIVENKKFKAQYGELERGEGMALSREPKGYEKDNPAIEYIKLKSWIASAQMEDTALTEKGLVKKIVTAFETLQPFISFLNQALDE